MRVPTLSAIALSATLLAGCGGSSPSQSTPAANTLPQAVALAAHDEPGAKKVKTFTVGLKTNNENYYTDKTYGKIFGIFKGVKAKSSRVIVIPLGRNVVFQNPDSDPHTGSLLGDASKNGADWPASFSGGNTASPAGTDISTAGFSTGIVPHDSASLTYSANVPGFYMFGCGIHYNTLGQRNIIIVQ